MARMVLLLAVVCLLAGCAQTSLTISHNGEITATANTVDSDKAAGIIKEMTNNMEEICNGDNLELKLNVAIDGDGMDSLAVENFQSLGSFGLKDIEKALGWLKKYLIWHAITVVGHCTGQD